MSPETKESKSSQALAVTVALVFLAIILIGGIWLIGKLPSTLTTAVVTGGIALVGSTMAVVVGKNHERQKEIDAAFREKKIVIYDEFLERFFKLFQEGDEASDNPDLVEYLRDHQRKIILWGGDQAVHEYANMMRAFRDNAVSAEAMISLIKYFKAVREDLGHSNKAIKDGDMISFLLTNGDLLMHFYEENPETAFEKLIAYENEAKKMENKSQ